MPDSNTVVSAPAPTEMDKLHDDFLGAFGKWAPPETLQEELKPIIKAKADYEAARTKYQTDTKAYTEAQAKANALPEKYTFTLADDSPLGKDYTKTIEAIAKEKKLTQAQANTLLADRDTTVRGFVKSQLDGFESAINASAEKLKAHPVLGGSNLAKTEELCTRFVETFGTPQSMEKMKKAGAFADPEIVEMIYKAATMIGSERLVMPKGVTKEANLADVGRDVPPSGFSQTKAQLAAAK